MDRDQILRVLGEWKRRVGPSGFGWSRRRWPGMVNGFGIG